MLFNTKGLAFLFAIVPLTMGVVLQVEFKGNGISSPSCSGGGLNRHADECHIPGEPCDRDDQCCPPYGRCNTDKNVWTIAPGTCYCGGARCVPGPDSSCCAGCNEQTLKCNPWKGCGQADGMIALLHPAY